MRWSVVICDFPASSMEEGGTETGWDGGIAVKSLQEAK